MIRKYWSSISNFKLCVILRAFFTVIVRLFKVLRFVFDLKGFEKFFFFCISYSRLKNNIDNIIKKKKRENHNYFVCLFDSNIWSDL